CLLRSGPSLRDVPVRHRFQDFAAGNPRRRLPSGPDPQYRPAGVEKTSPFRLRPGGTQRLSRNIRRKVRLRSPTFLRALSSRERLTEAGRGGFDVSSRATGGLSRTLISPCCRSRVSSQASLTWPKSSISSPASATVFP